MGDTEYKRYTCEGCNSLFDAVRAKRYCTRECNKAHLRRIGPQLTRAEYVAKIREHSSRKFYCVCCGVEGHRKIGGTNKSKGYVNKYCGMDCRIAIREKVRRECSFLAGLAASFRKTVTDKVSATSAVRRVAQAIARYASHREKAERPCMVCGCPVGYVFGRARMLCSKACQKKTESFKLAKKSAKLKRKSIKRGANGGEHVNPIKVFMAAGWKCQICNKPTPQRLRGSTHKRAPELDHVVPVSKGGAHTWANVQCACRECNLWKSDKIVTGQTNLFG